MKRIIAMATVVVGVAAALVLGTAGAASAATVNTTVDGISYTADDGSPAAGATITGYTPGSTDVVIPGTVTISGHDYSVTAIADNAFLNKSLTSVVIPDSVTTIGVAAFDGNALMSVTLGNSVTTIGNAAFRANLLTSVTIPGSVTTISDRAFEFNSLSSVNFSSGSLTTIGTSAFEDDFLTNVTIPDSVTTIGDDAFLSNRLTSLTLGDSVTTIGEFAFYENGLTSLTIPDSVTTIGDDAFELNHLTGLTLGNSVATIAEFAFAENALTNVTIPDSVTTIGDDAFELNQLTSLSLGNSVTTIGDFAFEQNQLTSVTIPGSVATIGADAFAFNYSLSTVLFTGSAPSVSNGASGAPLGPASVTVLFDVSHATGFTIPTWNGYNTGEVAAVSYDLNGHGTGIATHYVTYGGTETRPADPTAHGHTFAGWYTDAGLTTRANFSAAITADTTFYAKWSDPAVLALTGGTLNPGLGIGGILALVLGMLIVASRRRRTARA